MILKDWLKRRELANKAGEAVAECGLPEIQDRVSNPDKRARRQADAFSRLNRDLVGYARAQRLGIYGKAKLCKCVEAELQAADVPQEGINQFISRLAQSLAPFNPVGGAR